MSQPLVSHHLRILHENGLARPERRGSYTYYCLSDIAVWQAVEGCSKIARRLLEKEQEEEAIPKPAT